VSDARRPSVAVAVVPRERFSTTPSTLADVAARTTGADIVWIDNGHTPEQVAAVTAAAPAARRIEVERWARPGAMHNVAAEATDSDYIVFVDNDVTVNDGWLPAMVACAEETGADVVSPIILRIDRGSSQVHFTGGRVECTVEDSRLVIDDTHDNSAGALSLIPTIERHQTGLAELHCVLIRRSTFRAVGPFDPGLATRELIGWHLRLEALGGTVWLEPKAVATYAVPPPFTWRDRAYYLLRWSERWTDASFDHFERRHGIPLAEASRAWTRRQRLRAYGPWVDALARLVGHERAERFASSALSPVEVIANRMAVGAWRAVNPSIW
jgi:GT2 family glycosyltransferase